MKSFKYIAMGALALSMVACKDDGFFASESPSAIDGSVIFANPNTTEQVIAGIYEQFGQDKSYRNRMACGYQGLNTDAEHGTKNSGAADWNTYSITPVNGDVSTATGKDPWGYLNTAIERANNVIEGVQEYGDLKDNKMQYFLGEALFLRSFCYMEMVKYWGDVPPRFASIAKDPSGLDMKKEDRTVVLKQLRADLKRAAELMPWAAECPGTAANKTYRPSKGAAYALLARIDLMLAGKGVRPATWQTGAEFLIADAAERKALNEEVMWACSEVINHESGKFQGDYAKIFQDVCADVTDYSKSEIMWEIPFADGSRGQVLQYNCTKMSDAVSGLKNNTGGGSNSAVGIVPTLYYDYEEGDVRRDVTIARYIWVYDNGTKFNSDAAKVAAAFPQKDGSEKILYQKSQMVGGWYANKYRVEWMSRERNGNDDGVNFPIIRYTDVLLMAAEASIGGIGQDVPANMYGLTGQALFDQVRNRAHASTKTLNMDNLMMERKLEFTGEYLRKFDLMRWGVLDSKMKAEDARLQNMQAHTGEFAGLSDTIYYKFKYVGAEYSYKSDIKGFVLDSVWGMKPGETGAPATYSSANGWVKSSIYTGSGGDELSHSNFKMYNYDKPECLLNRQYWPIFSVNVGASNGALWNDYDY